MKTLKLVGLLFLLANAALADLPTITKTTSSATGTTVRKITVSVTVINRGQNPTDPAAVVVTCSPSVRGTKEGNTLRDPLDVGKAIGPLQPGESQTVTMDTPYESRNSFTDRSGNFRAINIDPTGEKVGSISSKVLPAQKR